MRSLFFFATISQSYIYIQIGIYQPLLNYYFKNLQLQLIEMGASSCKCASNVKVDNFKTKAKLHPKLNEGRTFDGDATNLVNMSNTLNISRSSHGTAAGQTRPFLHRRGSFEVAVRSSLQGYLDGYVPQQKYPIVEGKAEKVVENPQIKITSPQGGASRLLNNSEAKALNQDIVGLPFSYINKGQEESHPMRGMLSIGGSNEKNNNTKRSSFSYMSSLGKNGQAYKKTHTGAELEEEKVKSMGVPQQVDNVFSKARSFMVQSNNKHAHQELHPPQSSLKLSHLSEYSQCPSVEQESINQSQKFITKQNSIVKQVENKSPSKFQPRPSSTFSFNNPLVGENGMKKDSLIPPLPEAKSKTFVQQSENDHQQNSLMDFTRSRQRQKNNDIIDVRKRLLSNEKSFVEQSEKSWKSSGGQKIPSQSAQNEEEKVAGISQSRSINKSTEQAAASPQNENYPLTLKRLSNSTNGGAAVRLNLNQIKESNSDNLYSSDCSSQKEIQQVPSFEQSQDQQYPLQSQQILKQSSLHAPIPLNQGSSSVQARSSFFQQNANMPYDKQDFTNQQTFVEKAVSEELGITYLTYNNNNSFQNNREYFSRTDTHPPIKTSTMVEDHLFSQQYNNNNNNDDEVHHPSIFVHKPPEEDIVDNLTTQSKQQLTSGAGARVSYEGTEREFQGRISNNIVATPSAQMRQQEDRRQAAKDGSGRKLSGLPTAKTAPIQITVGPFDASQNSNNQAQRQKQRKRAGSIIDHNTHQFHRKQSNSNDETSPASTSGMSKASHQAKKKRHSLMIQPFQPLVVNNNQAFPQLEHAKVLLTHDGNLVVQLDQKQVYVRLKKRLSNLGSMMGGQHSQDESGEESRNGASGGGSNYQKSNSRPSIKAPPPGPLRLPTLQEQQEDEEKGSQYDRRNSINQSHLHSSIRKSQSSHSGDVTRKQSSLIQSSDIERQQNQVDQSFVTQATAALAHKNSLKGQKPAISRQANLDTIQESAEATFLEKKTYIQSTFDNPASAQPLPISADPEDQQSEDDSFQPVVLPPVTPSQQLVSILTFKQSFRKKAATSKNVLRLIRDQQSQAAALTKLQDVNSQIPPLTTNKLPQHGGSSPTNQQASNLLQTPTSSKKSKGQGRKRRKTMMMARRESAGEMIMIMQGNRYGTPGSMKERKPYNQGNTNLQMYYANDDRRNHANISVVPLGQDGNNIPKLKTRIRTEPNIDLSGQDRNIIKSGLPSLHEASKTESSKFIFAVETDPSKSTVSNKHKAFIQFQEQQSMIKNQSGNNSPNLIKLVREKTLHQPSTAPISDLFKAKRFSNPPGQDHPDFNQNSQKIHRLSARMQHNMHQQLSFQSEMVTSSYGLDSASRNDNDYQPQSSDSYCDEDEDDESDDVQYLDEESLPGEDVESGAAVSPKYNNQEQRDVTNSLTNNSQHRNDGAQTTTQNNTTTFPETDQSVASQAQIDIDAMVRDYQQILMMTPGQNILFERKLRKDLGQMAIYVDKSLRYRRKRFGERHRGTSSSVSGMSHNSRHTGIIGQNQNDIGRDQQQTAIENRRNQINEEIKVEHDPDRYDQAYQDIPLAKKMSLVEGLKEKERNETKALDPLQQPNSAPIPAAANPPRGSLLTPANLDILNQTLGSDHSSSRSITTMSVTRSRKNGKKKINQYIVNSLIGQGKFSKVYKCLNETNGLFYAMKIIDKKTMKSMLQYSINKEKKAYDFLQSEIAILKKLDHPNVLKLTEIIDDPGNEKLFLITEFVKNGALKEKMQKKPLAIEEIRKYFIGLISAIEYCHDYAMVLHRDIKAENILIDDNDEIKLADFGVSQMIEDGDDTCYSKAGTTLYFCPELCKGSTYHGKPADVWACGILLYYMTINNYPFFSTNIHDLHSYIQTLEPDYSQITDPRLVDLLKHILAKDPKIRYTIQQIMIHPWTTNNDKEPIRKLQSKKIQLTIADFKSLVSKVMKVNKVIGRLTPASHLPVNEQQQEHI